jgi:hypothetical protein
VVVVCACYTLSFKQYKYDACGDKEQQSPNNIIMRFKQGNTINTGNIKDSHQLDLIDHHWNTNK